MSYSVYVCLSCFLVTFLLTDTQPNVPILILFCVLVLFYLFAFFNSNPFKVSFARFNLLVGFFGSECTERCKRIKVKENKKQKLIVALEASEYIKNKNNLLSGTDLKY